MLDWLFGEKSNTYLGIDLGSSSIKIVELGRKDGRAFLVNYALAQTKSEAVFSVIDLKNEEIIKIIETLVDEAKISGRHANVSLPVEKTFSTVISLPAMPEKELAAAVSFEAQKYVPLPLDEVALDWTVISNTADQNTGTADKRGSGTATAEQNADLPRGEGKAAPSTLADTGKTLAGDGVSSSSSAQAIQVLLLAVPKETINRVVYIISQAGLKVAALEQEAFSLSRSLIGNDKNTFLIIDLGRQGTDLIVLDQGFIRLSHNLESVNKEIILMEIDRVVNLFQMRYNKKIGQCLLTGGRANEKDWLEFLGVKLKMPVKIGDPFARVGYNKNISGFLKELAPQMAVAAGLAMRTAD
ncbi:pilus assembly protein PilM [Patescibacteria group bacterium]|nr:pilus assembly protein PilM [Patescibacteria group bacterium]MBU2219764.1 pilus assembly protein PilM [Patescibacteria group bacterium]